MVDFTTTASTAVSTVLSASKLKVTHDYHPSPDTPNLYEVSVTLENTSGATISDLRYRRSMDWDVYPTPFNECVTIQPDPSLVTNLVNATNDGFMSTDPYQSITDLGGIAPFTGKSNETMCYNCHWFFLIHSTVHSQILARMITGPHSTSSLALLILENR